MLRRSDLHLHEKHPCPESSPLSPHWRRNNKTGLVPFITAGDPAPELTVPLMHALVAGGADILELGVPFSDPMAEGPVIQRACERALAAGVSMHDVLGYVREFRKTDATTPVVLMGYANPIERMGAGRLRRRRRRKPASTAPSWSTIRPRNARSSPPPMQAQRPRPDLPAGADLDRGAHRPGGALRQRLQLLRLAQGRDRRRQHRHRRRGAARSPPSASTSSCRSASASASATPPPPRRSAAVADAVVIGSRIIQEMENTPREQAVQAAQKFLSGIRQALDQ